ncbi:DUF424 family protein [Candidatus Thorarchaeota archaeon]|nr:MAG: DUF424 family protein [Candidatus Thorarchaeota archaeon]
MSSVYMRVRETLEHYLVAICDESLLGRTLTQGKLEFKVSKDFYGGDLVDMATCFEHIKKATILNMVGQDTVGAAIRAGLIHEKAVMYIEGEPHAQWVKL